eukprot:2147371-Pyramimonas_sp.AAC.1
MPHNATDDFVTQFATLVRANLRPDVKVHVELSNEMWHSGFPGGQFASAMGYSTGLGRLCWYVNRTREVADLWKAVYGEADRGRLVFVAESQHANSDATRQLVEDCAMGAAGDDIDAIALGPYFNGYDPTVTEADLDTVMASYAGAASVTGDEVAAHFNLSNARGFSLITYEAGPGGEGDGSGDDLAIAAHRDPRMRGL